MKALQEEEESREHPVDRHYRTLHCALVPLDQEHEDFQVSSLKYIYCIILLVLLKYRELK